MTSLVRTQDAIAFYKHKLTRYATKRDELNKAYQEATERYELKFFPKLFNWKFKDSFAGDKSWLSGNWGFADLDYFEETTKSYLDMCIYCSKLDQYLFEFKGGSSAFYKWANENNIPY